MKKIFFFFFITLAYSTPLASMQRGFRLPTSEEMDRLMAKAFGGITQSSPTPPSTKPPAEQKKAPPPVAPTLSQDVIRHALEQSQEQRKRLENLVKETKATCDTLSHEYTELRTQHAELTQQLQQKVATTVDAQFAATETLRTQQETQQTTRAEEKKILTAQQRTLQRELIQVNQQIESAQKETVTLKKELRNVQQEIATLQEKIKKAKDYTL